MNQKQALTKQSRWAASRLDALHQGGKAIDDLHGSLARARKAERLAARQLCKDALQSAGKDSTS